MDEDYLKDMKALMFSIVGKLNLHKGDVPPSLMELMENLDAIWRV